MSGNVKTEKLKEVKTILISQPQPSNKSPYHELETRYGITIDFRPFIHVEPVSEKEFRRQRIRLDEYECVIFTSKNAIENFFRLSEETRVKVSAETKYFCLSEAIANYLQKFIIYRKRKVFVGRKTIEDLTSSILKHKAGNRFLLPCSNLGALPVVEFLKKSQINFVESMMYRTVSSDLSDLADIKYDILVFFSPLGIQSLYENFPDFSQDETRIAVFGNSTSKAVEERGLTINIQAPVPDAPSMPMALENYIKLSNKV
ncbi:MAG TPA: uroporphyrinogen-III synthase [Saprospiraceae bacterium]|nr:uroporphyrinogen-III synthase [Saprospiraceae bacterium]MCB9269926.1 uroporphyrinogen-III synthase [Lewinellaceae bacterium]HPG07170.1 uroporphyrinogen-III synthase [Saprospiraceae bacterium]HPR00885.1 uroporphyrinogen-III synthase [Saprospiraceae bacterium]HQU52153.1 uroporphyrinogen-III synthase [Saprospiraceae bacterium]